MPHKYKCCVPGCLNNFRNAPELHYYRIPKDEGQRKIYKNILKNKTLKLESQATSKVTNHYMPEVFQKFFPNTKTIVDCTEVEMEKPSALDNQSMCYSSYKARNTMKVLIGISPSGVINFVSEFFPGSASDKEIVIQSNFLAKLKQGDQVMADKGFNYKDELASVGAELILPHFNHSNKKQFSKEETEHTKKVATLRIHVERTMERIKNWHILDHRIPVTSSDIASDMLIVIFGLSNFLPPLIN